MAELQAYEIALMLMMYDKGIMGESGYTAIEKVARRARWTDIQKAYGISDSIETVTRRLVNAKLLSDRGKSMDVVSLDKLGAQFCKAYLKQNRDAMADLEAKLNEKK